MPNVKEQIINWFNGPQDYDQGIALLQKVCRKNKIIEKLIKRGGAKGSFEKLIWELNKVAGLKKIPQPQEIIINDKSKKTKVEEKISPQEGNAPEKTKYNLIGDKDIDSYPPEVNRLVKEYSSLYMQRGQNHSVLKKIGDGNELVTIDTRKPIIDAIKIMSDRMEVLNEAFRSYEKDGKLIEVAVLWPEVKTEETSLQITGPPDTIDELKTQKKNIQSSITKDRNLLTYGGKTKPKDGKEKPVPAGPKRTTLEKRIAKKEKEIAALDQRIADIG